MPKSNQNILQVYKPHTTPQHQGPYRSDSCISSVKKLHSFIHLSVANESIQHAAKDDVIGLQATLTLHLLRRNRLFRRDHNSSHMEPNSGAFWAPEPFLFVSQASFQKCQHLSGRFKLAYALMMDPYVGTEGRKLDCSLAQARHGGTACPTAPCTACPKSTVPRGKLVEETFQAPGLFNVRRH